MNIRKNFLILISLIFLNYNCIASCYQKSIFDDGKNGKDIYLQNNLCYDGDAIKAENGENSIFGNGGKGGNISIPPEAVIFMSKDQTLKSGDGGDSIFGDAGDGGDIYNE